jgi:hypothetical protein
MSSSTDGSVSWFRKPSPDRPGTLNATYQLLDRAIVAGRSDEPVLIDGGTPVSHAVLLEEVATIGGVLVGQGVVPGDPVRVDLEPDRRGATVLLAVARVGAVLEDSAPTAITAEDLAGVPWHLVRDVGRGDPAPAGALPGDAPWTRTRSVTDLALDLAAAPTPLTPADLVRLLAGPTIGR